MKAVGLTRYLPIEDPEALLDVTLDAPAATARPAVEVRAIAVNPVDIKVRSSKEHVESAPRVLGWDAAGVVEAVGDAGHPVQARRRGLLRRPHRAALAATPSCTWSTSASSASKPKTPRTSPRPPRCR